MSALSSQERSLPGEAAPLSIRPNRFLWGLPYLAFLLLIASVGALLWYLDRNERENQRANLISDMLWLEQNLQFQLRHNEELLTHLPHGEGVSTADFSAHARSMMTMESGLVEVLWYSPAGRLLMAYPPLQPSQDLDFEEDALRLVAHLSRASYTSPVPNKEHDWRFKVQVPVYDDQRLAGIAVGVYSVPRLLDQLVPWWLAERYYLSIVDAQGNILAQRTKLDLPDLGEPYQLAFDPPGHGLTIRAIPFRRATPFPGRLITAALIVLAVLVVGSFLALRRDVAKRLAAENALKEEVAFRKAMEDSLQTGLRARTLDGRITYVNPAFCRMVGWRAEELVGRSPPMPYWAEEYLDETKQMHARVLAGNAPMEGFEIKLKRKNGEIFDALIHESPLIDSRGRHVGWMGSVVDITERKRTAEFLRQQEERLQASARLIAMGEMASSLAHELNQPLAAIAGYLTGCRNLIESGQTDCHEIEAAIAKCLDQAHRAGQVIRRIYAFARRHEPHSEPCDVKTLLHDLVHLIEADARRHGIRLALELDDALPIISADRVLLSQAIFNLMKNGIEAMLESKPGSALLSVAAHAERDRLLIIVADRGPGLKPEIAARLFEPFFTTKQEGLGVGLNICRSVVEAHGGRLWHEPNPGGGSRFIIAVPLRQEGNGT